MDTYNDPVLNICLDFAFTAVRVNGDYAFWLNLAERRWTEMFGTSEVTPQMWDKVRNLLRVDYPDLIERHYLLRRFVENPDFEFPPY